MSRYGVSRNFSNSLSYTVRQSFFIHRGDRSVQNSPHCPVFRQKNASGCPVVRFRPGRGFTMPIPFLIRNALFLVKNTPFLIRNTLFLIKNALFLNSKVYAAASWPPFGKVACDSFPASLRGVWVDGQNAVHRRNGMCNWG